MPAPIGGTRPINTTPSTLTTPLGCAAFRKDATLSKIAAGSGAEIAKGAPKSETVKTLQTALFSLGYLKARTGLDGSFGPGTEGAVKSFQLVSLLPPTGKLDATTLAALDKASSDQIATLKAKTIGDDSKRSSFHIVADISDPKKTRLYVMSSDNKIQARYLTSPGRAEFPTAGNHFKIQDVFTRAPWNPPSSGWANGSKQVPPGIDNPMGITKLSFGQYSEYIHGIPASEEAELGHAASHGCLRMSGSNVLELSEKYAGAGSDVTINRDRSAGAKLEAQYTASGVQERPTDAGREYLFGYASGELGSSRHYNP
jgi:peptidoglycan hydrolase-like protein with peptidoglycan-binding domain